MKYDPRKWGAYCDRCPRRHQTVVPPTPRPGAYWVWIGQDPGQQEVKQGIPFIGATGKRLSRIWEQACNEAGIPTIPRSEIHVTNAALCMPITKSDREARQAVDCCRPRLMQELAKVHPDAGILVMGRWAVYSLIGMDKKVGSLTGFHVRLSQPKGKGASRDLRKGTRYKEPTDTTKLKIKDEDDIPF